MTSTLPANALAGTPVGTNRKSLLATTTGMEQPLFFVQLLSLVQGVDVALEESQLTADGTVPPAPDGQELPTAEDSTQVAIWQGFPALVEVPPFLLFPPANTGTPSDPSPSAPAAPSARAEATALRSPERGKPFAGEASPVPPFSVGDGAETTHGYEPIANPVAASPSTQEPFSVPYESIREPVAQSWQEKPSATEVPPMVAEMRKRSESGSEKAEAPIEVSPTPASTSLSAASALMQGRHMRSAENNDAEAPQGVQFASAIRPRFQTRKSGAEDGDSVPSPVSSEANALHITPNVHITAATRPTREPSAPLEVSPAEVVRQVAQQLEEVTRARSGSSVTLQLEPEHLGRLRVTISMVDDAIHTRIIVTNHAVRHMLENHSSLLQQALQERGLQLGALQVSVQGEGRQFPMYHAYVTPTMQQSWLQAEEGTPAVAERIFWHPQTGGVNLLV